MDFSRIKIFKCKKGMSDELFFTIFEVILVAIITVALYNFITDVSEKTIFEKNYLARDMALLINTLYAAPGEVSYAYNEDTTKFKLIYKFSPNKIEVYEKEEALQQNHPFYLFAENKNMEFGYGEIEYREKTITMFSKNDESIGVASVRDTTLS
ncbi:hypothetical protein HY637_03260 [Candidatus Woesearchaeota archaeon]|nr:hypothetical protein [Candidatus Woesearchaeota archaeon]